MTRIASLLGLLAFSFSFLPANAAAQEIIGVAPYTGPYTGNQTVQIRGSSFLPTCGIVMCFPEAVYFGSERADVLSWTDTVITVRTPAHSIGAADVTVASRNGSAVVAPSGFSFITGNLEEQVLLPLLMSERPGGFGSLWRTHLTIRNGYSSPVSVDPYSLTIPGGGVVKDPPSLTPSPSDAIPARILWLRRDSEDILTIELRAQDMSRQRETWGVEVPVVREEEFRVRAISLLDVPTESQFRVTLRIYGLDRFDEAGSASHQFTVRAYDQSSNRLLAQRTVTAEVTEAFTTPPTAHVRPALFQMFDVVAAMPEVASSERLRLEIVPFSPLPVYPPPVSLFWAFVSVTHNTTQTVTLVTPD